MISYLTSETDPRARTEGLLVKLANGRVAKSDVGRALATTEGRS